MEQSVFEKYAMAYVECVDSYEKSIEELEALISALKAEKEFESVLASPKISKSNKKKKSADATETQYCHQRI